MKIIMGIDNAVSFESLDAGDVFMVNDVVYLKCDAFRREEANAVCLEIGKICMFDSATKVYPVEAELHVSKLVGGDTQ